MLKKIQITDKNSKYVRLKFKCPNCKNIVASETLEIPNLVTINEEPTAPRSFTTQDACWHCDFNYGIRINTTTIDRYIEITSLPDNIDVQIEEMMDNDYQYMFEQICSFLYGTPPMKIFNKEIIKLRDLLNIKITDGELQKTLYKQLYSGLITCMEDYTSTTFIKKVVGNQELTIKFLKNDTQLKKICEPYNESIIKNKIPKRLLSITFHNMRTVSDLFKNVLSCDIPEYSSIYKIVQNRHHMVHRNGKDNNGNEIIIDKKIVANAILEVEKFVGELDNKIIALDPDNQPFPIFENSKITI